MKGMDPMMHQLLTQGHDIEWHVVLINCSLLDTLFDTVGNLVTRYKALAEATGGGFLHIDEPGLMEDMSVQDLLGMLRREMRPELRGQFERKKQQGALFLEKLHKSNLCIEDAQGDSKRRIRQLQDFKRTKGSTDLPWISLLEPGKGGSKT